MKNKLFFMFFSSALMLFLVACSSQREAVINKTTQITPATSSAGTLSSSAPIVPSATPDISFITSDDQEFQNLDSWLGDYHGSIDVFQDEREIYAKIDLIIYQTSEGFFGYFNVNEDGGDLYERILVKVQGSEQKIQLGFLENIYVDEKEQGTIFSEYQLNQLVCTITANGENLSTIWSNIQSKQEETHFRKSDDPASVIIRSPEDKYEFLKAFGIEKDDIPFYQYYDEDDNELMVDFYYHQEEKIGIGIYYGRLTMCGFETAPYTQENWIDPTCLRYPNYADADFYSSILDYKEHNEYNEDNQLTRFCVTGIIDGFSSFEEEKLIEIINIYRDNGMIFQKKCFYNSFLFGSTRSTESYYYDKQERIGMTSAYITHGSLEDFYIYEADSSTPSYSFSLDHNSWKADAFSFIKYSPK